MGLAAGAGGVRAAGVTLITHGFNGNITDWVIPMADRYLAHENFPGTTLSCYEIEITSGGTSVAFLGGTAPTATDSGEIFIKLNWSSLAGLGGATTTTVASRAVEALLSKDLIPELGGRPLAELPLHLAGHSRGGSVVTQMARLLGAQGVWVDHVTTWDPVPVGLLGDDPTVTTYANVLFADNFWQDLGNGFTDPTGQEVFGAYNRQLLVLGGGYSLNHSDVHLWYHGTIDLATPATDTGGSITASQRSTWWTAAEAAGAVAGSHYSLIGGGDRLSQVEPAGSGKGRIRDGFNQRWDLGGGLATNRTALAANSGLWPNAILCELMTSDPVAAGDSFPLAVYHQSGSGLAGEIELRVLLDADFNPWNGNEIEVDRRALPNTGTGEIMRSELTVSIDAASTAPGRFAVCAQVGDGTRTRYLYAPQTLELTSSNQPLTIDRDSVTMLGGVIGFDVLASPGQQVALMATTDLEDWVQIGSHLFTTGVWQFTDLESPLFPRRFYKPMLLP